MDEGKYMDRQHTAHICFHVMRSAHRDVRAMRAMRTLAATGYTMTLVDIADIDARIDDSVIGDTNVSVKHITLSHWRLHRRRETLFFLQASFAVCLAIYYLWRANADIYHACEVTALPACFIVALLRRKQLVYEAYELPLHDVAWDEMGLLRKGVHLLLMMLLRVMLPYCSALIAVSMPIVEFMRKQYKMKKVLLLRNMPEYQYVDKEYLFHTTFHLPAATRIVLYQGNLQVDRGLERLVRAAMFLQKDTLLVLMGQNVGLTRTALEKIIELERIAERVKIMPAVPYHELLRWTASADLGLLLTPLDYTLNMRLSLPNKFFEYLMAGLPVLTSPLIAVREIVQTHCVGRVVSDLAPHIVANMINDMLVHQDELLHMRKNALEIAKEFCWDREQQVLITLYKELIRDM
jgi:glycosyltransferase involved in cell wall biosynthesis